MTMKNRSLDNDTREVDTLTDLLPCSIEFMLEVVQYRASVVTPTPDSRPHTMADMRAFLACLFGASQFKEGTDLWATTPIGLMNPPNFGRRIKKGKFDRIMRCLRRGPEGCEDEAGEGPWCPVRWMVDGFNKTRKRECKWGWCSIIDETMFAWRGKSGTGGMPHLSYIPRKPEDLGCELKTLCDGTSGVMMCMEIQEGKVRMNRKKHHQQCGATTACTLRCLEESGHAQKDRRPEEREPRTCGGDSWFAGLRTTRACDDEFGIKFIGPVKTNTKGFPRDAIRHTLHGTPRGTHIVFEERDEHNEKTGVCAIGWNDHVGKPGGGPTQFRGDPRCGGGKKKRPREARGRRQVQVVEIKNRWPV